MRAEDDSAAQSRVKDTLQKRGLDLEANRFEIYASDLAKRGLGLQLEVYKKLVEEVDIVIHVGLPLLLTRSYRVQERSVDLLRLDVANAVTSGGLACTFRE